MENSILFVGGTWDLSGGRGSKIVSKFSSYLSNVTVYNGGNYNELNEILKSCINYDIVIWWANVPNELPKVRNVKEINYKAMLVSSKRNVDGRYSFNDLLQRSLSLKANLTIEFTRNNDLYVMKLFDPLGNVWYEGTDIETCSNELIARLNFIKDITRESTFSLKDNNDFLNVPVKREFFKIVRDYVFKFSLAMFESNDFKRFLGNASFRCPKGFPSFRNGKYIFVSRRNVNKQFIGSEEFVPVLFDSEKIYYYGDNKPSVDTPIQVRLYEKLSNINYMIHSHCYIKDAPFTKMALPCGAIEEVYEVLNLIDDFYKDFYLINLIGHGSIMMSKYPEQLKDIDIIGRKLPENMYQKKLFLKR